MQSAAKRVVRIEANTNVALCTDCSCWIRSRAGSRLFTYSLSLTSYRQFSEGSSYPGIGGSSMLDPELLEILVCPETKQPIRLADPGVLQKLNVAIAEGSISNKGGEPVSERIEEGLIREDDSCLYPVRDDIPIMLIDSAIPLSVDTASD